MIKSNDIDGNNVDVLLKQRFLFEDIDLHKLLARLSIFAYTS